MDITIYHNPRCGTSRNTLQLLREAGHEPRIIAYLTHPPSRATLQDLIARAGLTGRAAMRVKEPQYAELGLADADDGTLLDAMLAHPILIERPFVVTPLGVRLCRPKERVFEILPEAAPL